MISLQKIGNEHNSELLEFDGLSTDDKPINIYRNKEIINGSIFNEMDTGKIYKYNKTTSTWVEQPSNTGVSGNISLDYTALTNKPQINGIELDGIKTLDELGVQPKGKYLTTETDPTVPAWAKEKNKPTYTATEVGALPSSTTALPNPKKIKFTGAITGEYDGSSEQTFNIPQSSITQATDNILGGIKAKTKTSETVEAAIDPVTGKLYVPSYPKQTNIELDKTLSTEGKAADAKATGDLIKSKIGSDVLTQYMKTADADSKYALKTQLPKQGVAVPDAGDANIKDTLNNLLTSLRTAGLIAK